MEDPLKSSRFVNVIAAIGLFAGLIGLVFSFHAVMGPYAFVIALPSVAVCGLALYFDYQEKTRSVFAVAAMGVSIICVAVPLYQHYSIIADHSKIKEQARTEERMVLKEQTAHGLDNLDNMKKALENGTTAVFAGENANKNKFKLVLEETETLLEYDSQLTQMQAELSAEKTALDQIQAAGVTQENYEAVMNRIIMYNKRFAQFTEMFAKFSALLEKAEKTQAAIDPPGNARAITPSLPLNAPPSGSNSLTAVPRRAAPPAGGCSAMPAREGAPTGCAAGSMGLN